MGITPKQAEAVLSRANCLYDDNAVQAVLDVMARQISEKIQHENPLILCVMTGGLITCSELLKRFSFPLEVDYLHATRYGDDIVGDELNWISRPHKSLQDRTVLIIDDILDVGQTLYQIEQFVNQQGARQTYTAVLVDKLHDRKSGLLKADFAGLTVPDRYVFGYGMDYKHFLRNVSGIYAAGAEDE